MGTSPTVHALGQNPTPPPRVNLQMKPVTPVSTQRYQFGEVRMDGEQHSSRISGHDLTARLVPNPVHVPPRLSNPSVVPYQGSVSMQSQVVGTENQRVPNQRRMLAVCEAWHKRPALVLSGLGLSKQDSCLGRTRGGGISAATGVGSLTSGGCGAWVDLAKGPGVGEGGVVGEDGGGWGCGAST